MRVRATNTAKPGTQAVYEVFSHYLPALAESPPVKTPPSPPAPGNLCSYMVSRTASVTDTTCHVIWQQGRSGAERPFPAAGPQPGAAEQGARAAACRPKPAPPPSAGVCTTPSLTLDPNPAKDHQVCVGQTTRCMGRQAVARCQKHDVMGSGHGICVLPCVH